MQETKGQAIKNASQRCRSPAGGVRPGISERHRAARAITCPVLHGVPAVKHELEVCAKLHYGIFDSEGKQLQAILELRNILKYYEISIPDLNKNTPTWKVLSAILEKLHGLIPDDFQWEVIDSPDYLIRIFYKYLDMGEYDFYIIPLEYLPRLKKQNHKAYNLILLMINLLNKHCNMPHMDMDERMLDWFEDLIEEEKAMPDPDENMISHYSDIIDAYSKEPSLYADCITQLKFSIDDFTQMLARFNPENELEAEIFKWCLKGYELIRSGWEYRDFLDYEHEDDCDGINPFAYMRFVWSVEDDMGEAIIQDTEDMGNSCGVLPFIYNFYLSSRDCLEIDRLKIPQWPYDLLTFLAMGSDISDKINGI